jgi:isocitrate dehydrogenase (NAD+)
MSDGLFLECARQIQQEEYPNIEYSELIIDAGCMKLVQDPSRFDVLLMENLYGDLVSDLCAGLVGGLGVVPGSNIGDNAAVFEAVHGSAPDIAGKGIANPLAAILSFEMALRWSLGRPDLADRLGGAVKAALDGGARTRDIGGQLSTREMGDAVLAGL